MDATCTEVGRSRPIQDSGLSVEQARLRRRYFSNPYSAADEAVKQPQRERVLQFLLQNHQGPRVRLLSLPGREWRFEKMLQDATGGKSRFVGMEFNWGTLELGAPFMPGTKRATRKLMELPIGRLHGYETDLAKWIHVYAGDFFHLRRQERTSTKKERLQFAKDFKSNTAVWLDTTNSLGNEAVRCLTGLQSFVDIRRAWVPVAITLVAGREHDGLEDGDGALERRLPVICRLLNQKAFRTFVLRDAWIYQSAAGCQMMNVLGVFKRPTAGDLVSKAQEFFPAQLQAELFGGEQ